MRKRREPGSLARSLALFVLANALPLGAAAWLLVLAKRGDVHFRPLPEEGVGLLVGLGVVLALIVALGWGAYPALAFALETVGDRLRGLLDRWRAAGLAARALLAAPIAGLALAVAFLWVDVVAVALCVLALVAAEVDILITLALRLRS